ncbi:hypothetical protein MRX96_045054 [Rhipicephalus microplus]
MTALLRFIFLHLALQSLWSGDFHIRNVCASNCEHDAKSFTQQLLELHNASIKAAVRKEGNRPVHFAEPCPGFCTENSLGSSCFPGCSCRVLRKLKKPLFMCFQEGKTLPMGFSDY